MVIGEQGLAALAWGTFEDEYKIEGGSNWEERRQMLSISSVYSDWTPIFGEILTEYSPSVWGAFCCAFLGPFLTSFWTPLFSWETCFTGFCVIGLLFSGPFWTSFGPYFSSHGRRVTHLQPAILPPADDFLHRSDLPQICPPPQISYTSAKFTNASAASPCSPLTSSSILKKFAKIALNWKLRWSTKLKK